MDSHQPQVDNDAPAPNAAAVPFITTEHFTLQSARASTISESTGRASMFLAGVSGGLVALGLVATATHVDTAFYAFGLIIIPTLAFIGFVTFERVLQSGIEDYGYARRIARLRGYYFDNAPELTPYLLSVPPADRLKVQGLGGGPFQGFLTVAGMVAVTTSVIAGSAAGLLASVISDHSLGAALATGALFALTSLAGLLRYQQSAWRRAQTAQLFAHDDVVL